MNEIFHDVFGKIIYNTYWNRAYNVFFLGKEVMVTLVIDGDEDGEFEPSQVLAFQYFDKNKSILMKAVEEMLFKNYKETYKENRMRYTDNADEVLPEISSANQLSEVISITKVIISETFDEESKEVGLMFDASWEPELGIGVKIINGDVAEVGTQDIIL